MACWEGVKVGVAVGVEVAVGVGVALGVEAATWVGVAGGCCVANAPLMTNIPPVITASTRNKTINISHGCNVRFGALRLIS